MKQDTALHVKNLRAQDAPMYIQMLFAGVCTNPLNYSHKIQQQ